MKKFKAWLLIPALTVLLAGCGMQMPGTAGQETVTEEPTGGNGVPAVTDAAQTSCEASLPETEPEPSAPEESTVYLSDALDGIFICDLEDSGDPALQEQLEIRIYGGMVMLEHHIVIAGTRELYDTWAEEFWPEFPGILNTRCVSIEGKSQCSSVMAFGGNFQDLPVQKTLTVRGDLLSVEEEGGRRTVYERSRSGSLHTGTEALSDLLKQFGTGEVFSETAGTRMYEKDGTVIRMHLLPDGGFSYAEKVPGRPSVIRNGAWAQNPEDGSLMTLSEQAGYGAMPVFCVYPCRKTEDGGLWLRAEEDALPVPGELCFEPLDGSWSLNPRNRDPFGYFIDASDESGTYRDTDGRETAYHYRIPQMIGTLAAAEEINAGIQEALAEPVQTMLEKTARQEPVELLSADWESSRFETMLFLMTRTEDISGFVNYRVYCCDLEEGRMLRTPDILKKLGIPEEDFTEAVRKEAEICFGAENGVLPDAVLLHEDSKRQLDWTLSQDNINSDMMVYIDAEGRLAAVARVGTVTGSDWYYQLLYPDCHSEPH